MGQMSKWASSQTLQIFFEYKKVYFKTPSCWFNLNVNFIQSLMSKCIDIIICQYSVRTLKLSFCEAFNSVFKLSRKCNFPGKHFQVTFSMQFKYSRMVIQEIFVQTFVTFYLVNCFFTASFFTVGKHGEPSSKLTIEALEHGVKHVQS